MTPNTCEHCGSVLSAVTWTCVRGAFCPGARPSVQRVRHEATLKANGAAYFDSSAGLVPCRVLSITGEPGPASSAQEVTFAITASLGPYKRGEILSSDALSVVPRAAVRRRKHGVVIIPYSVECGMHRS